MQTVRPPLIRIALPWLAAVLGVLAAIAAGVVLAQVLMEPTDEELRDLGLYFAVTGAATLAGGWLALLAIGRVGRFSIQAKVFAGGLIATGVTLVNVFVVAQLMFISTSHDLKLLLAFIGFSAVISVIFGTWVARAVAGRLTKITDAVRSLAEGDLLARVHVSGGDEVAALANDVNALAARLEAAEEQRRALDRERRELTTAISHDLRTPLASLRAMVEALDDHVVEGAEVDRYYGTMRREIDRLSRMIDDLFDLAQMDAGALRLAREQVSLREIAADVVDALQLQAKRHGITIDLHADDNLEASLDGSRIERAIANLVRNAIEHTPEGGRIAVSVRGNNGRVEVHVADTGEGIPADDLPHIWDRFYRAEKSRSRHSRNEDGAGLGLAIVRGIVEAHGGHVHAESSPGQGAEFVIALPRA